MTKQTPPLWKQLVGAMAGGAIALVIYYGYEVAEPHLTAYIQLPESWINRPTEELVNTARGDLSDSEMDRIAQRARQAAMAQASRFNSVPPEPVVTREPVVVRQPVQQQAWEDTLNEWEQLEASALDVEEAWKDVPVPGTEPPAPAPKPEQPWEDPFDGGMVASVSNTPAPSLPSSGVQFWLAAFVAVAGAMYYTIRRRRTAENV